MTTLTSLVSLVSYVKKNKILSHLIVFVSFQHLIQSILKPEHPKDNSSEIINIQEYITNSYKRSSLLYQFDFIVICYNEPYTCILSE